MGIFSRLSSIIESNINYLLDKSEDPEKMLEQSLREMTEGMREAKVAVARSIRDKKIIEKKRDDALAQVGQWEDKATIALQKGNEALAREALKRKKDFEKIANEFSEQLETQEKNCEMMKSTLSALERKYEEARRKKDLLVARAQGAKAQKQMADQMSTFSENSFADTFERMEKKVNMMEAEADAAKELSTIEADTLQNEFALLEANDDVDDDLARLKAQLGMDHGKPKEIPPAS